MAVIDVIDRGLAESQQNVINLTEPDYDVYPLFIVTESMLNVRIDLVIESKDMLGEGMVWDHPTAGLWDENDWADDAPGFILGHPKYGVLGKSRLGSNEAPWVVEQEWINI